MKRSVAILVVVLLMLTVALSGCGESEALKELREKREKTSEQGDDLRHLSKLISEGTKEEYEKANIEYYKKWYGENWQEEWEKSKKIGEEAADKFREQLNKDK